MLKNLKQNYFLLYTIFLLIITACGDNNWFSGMRNDDINGDVASLTATADKAMKDKDYRKAKKYYEAILDKEPNNSVANYGMAEIAFKENGIDLAHILANVMENNNGNINASNPGNLLSIDNLDDLYKASNDVVKYLSKIVYGPSDGVIKYDDVDVNVNFAIALTLNSVLSIMDTDGDGKPAGNGDIFNITKDFDVLVNVNGEQKRIDTISDWSQVFSNISNQDKVSIQTNLAESLNNIDKAIDRLEVVNSSMQGTSSSIESLKDSFNDLKQQTEKIVII
ncbi:MAG: tetratricopeptide repeat protein [Elusimicrobiota bacterium]|jgi:tetratricopeptide (TPR) repeat protein|nr:tetratricopeptide repeat protein [Elusimicrobiota bacterium]